MKIVGLILIGIGLLTAIFDIFTGRIPAKWALILISLPTAVGALCFFEARIALQIIGFQIIGTGIWLWLERIHEKLSNTTIDRFKTPLGRLGVLIISIIIFLIIRYLLYPFIKTFLEHLGKFINTPKLISVIVTFIVIYCVTIFIFGVLYAALHLKFNERGFSSQQPLHLHDFFLYSAFNIATQGYKDVVPEHLMLASLSIIQIFIGLILLGIYLAGAFTFVVQSPPCA